MNIKGMGPELTTLFDVEKFEESFSEVFEKTKPDDEELESKIEKFLQEPAV